MGRELKRVVAGFDWPMNQMWDGFLMPEPLCSLSCTVCDQSGYNPATRQIADDFYDLDGFGVRWSYDYQHDPQGKPATRAPWRIIERYPGACRKWCDSITQDEVQALIDKGRLMDFTHIWKAGEGWKPRTDGYTPTAAEVNAWNAAGMGHDGINRGILIRVRATRLGVYGLCAASEGHGYTFRDEQHRAENEAWTQTEPPSGDWWQLWETVSEGSPVSPAFATAEELAHYLAHNGDAWYQKRMAEGREDTNSDYDTWLAWLTGAGWAPSGMLIDGQMVRPVDAIVESGKDNEAK